VGGLDSASCHSLLAKTAAGLGTLDQRASGDIARGELHRAEELLVEGLARGRGRVGHHEHVGIREVGCESVRKLSVDV